MFVLVMQAHSRTPKPLPFNALARARNGAQHLDVVFGRDWHERIDQKSLNIGDARLCMLGQLYGGYTIGCGEIGIEPDGFEARELGFCPEGSCYESQDEFRALTEAWKIVIDEHCKPCAA